MFLKFTNRSHVADAFIATHGPISLVCGKSIFLTGSILEANTGLCAGCGGTASTGKCDNSFYDSRLGAYCYCKDSKDCSATSCAVPLVFNTEHSNVYNNLGSKTCPEAGPCLESAQLSWHRGDTAKSCDQTCAASAPKAPGGSYARPCPASV